MIACIISTTVVWRLWIDIEKFSGVDLMEMITVSDANIKSVIALDDETTTASHVDKMIKSTHHRGFPIIDIEGNLVGIVTRKDIIKAFANGKAEIPVKEIMTKDIIVCYPDENLRTAFEKLGEGNIGRIPVVERDNPRHLIGLITRKSIVDAYNHALKNKEEV